MKNLKRFLTALLCIVMLITSICTTSFANSNGNELLGYNSKELKSMERFDKVFLEKQSHSSELYDKLNRSFGDLKLRKADDYPDYYGGAYINNDGQLVVNVSENSIESSQDLKKRITTDDYITKPCKYSFQMLTKIMDTLNTYKLENPDKPICSNFNSYALLDDQNIVVVYLDNYSQEQIEAFKEQVLNSPAIVFEKAKDTNHLEVNVNPGSRLDTSTEVASMGYRAKLNNVVGFVTAGHFVNIDDIVSKNDTEMAECTARQFSGSVDAAFCEITDSDYTPTNTLEGTSNTLSTTISEPGVGTVINKIGATTGHTSGTVLSTNASWTVGGVTFTNLTSADYTSNGGDSGGIVYSYISSTNTRYTLGIHQGASGSTHYYIKANQINSALGTSRY